MMLKDFKWSKDAFKNTQSVLLILLIFGILYFKPDLRDAMLMILTLIVKHYYDSNTNAAKNADTMNSMAKSIPDAPNNDPSK